MDDTSKSSEQILTALAELKAMSGSICVLLTKVLSELTELQGRELRGEEVNPKKNWTLVDDLGLPYRQLSRLLGHRIEYVEELVERRERDLRGIKGFGNSGVRNVRHALAKRGLFLRGEKPAKGEQL